MDDPTNEQPPNEEKKPAADGLRGWGFDLDIFEARAKESLGGAKDGMKDVMGALREALAQTRTRVSSAAKTSAPAASELKMAFEKAWQELEGGFLRAGEKMREARKEREKEEPPKEEPPQLPGA